MNVKIYTADSASFLESQVNSFMSGRYIQDVKFVAYHVNNQAKYKAMIIYGSESEVAKKVVCSE